MKAIVEIDDNGDQLLIIPAELINSGLFLEGDEVLFYVKNDTFVMKNLSCVQMQVSRFKRNLNSIIKSINNVDHPLNRVLVKRGGSAFWVISHDKSKRREFFASMFPEQDSKQD